MLRNVLFLVGALFLGWTVYTSFTQVRSDQRAVVRRFGRILDRKPQPGLYIGLPWGIDRVDLLAPVGPERMLTIGFNEREDKDDEVVPAGQVLTGDHNLVNVQATIRYKVREEDMDKYVLQQDKVDAFIARAAESLVAEWFAGQKINDVLVRGKNELPRFLRAQLPERLKDYELGIDFESASISMLHPPAQVKDAFDKRAQAEASIDTLKNQATQLANSQESTAQAAKNKLLGLAKVYAENEIDRANTEAANFNLRLDHYRKASKGNPDYLNALWLDETTRVYTRMKEAGQIRLLEHFMNGGELTITEFPLQPRKK